MILSGQEFSAVSALSQTRAKPGPRLQKKNSCSTQLSMKCFLLINVKIPTTVNYLSHSMKSFLLINVKIPTTVNYGISHMA